MKTLIIGGLEDKDLIDIVGVLQLADSPIAFQIIDDTQNDVKVLPKFEPPTRKGGKQGAAFKAKPNLQVAKVLADLGETTIGGLLFGEIVRNNAGHGITATRLKQLFSGLNPGSIENKLTELKKDGLIEAAEVVADANGVDEPEQPTA